MPASLDPSFAGDRGPRGEGEGEGGGGEQGRVSAAEAPWIRTEPSGRDHHRRDDSIAAAIETVSRGDPSLSLSLSPSLSIYPSIYRSIYLSLSLSLPLVRPEWEEAGKRDDLFSIAVTRIQIGRAQIAHIVAQNGLGVIFLRGGRGEGKRPRREPGWGGREGRQEAKSALESATQSLAVFFSLYRLQ